MGRGNTTYLKGMAVTAVFFAHFMNYYATGSYDREYGFAVDLVSLFFILSGLGVFFSLKRRLSAGASTSRAIAGFLLDRAIRIYPVYWLALFLTPFFFPEYQMLHRASIFTLGVFLGFPFIEAPGFFWFVTAIIQCYLLAPLLYLALMKLQSARFLWVNIFLLNFFAFLTFFILVLHQEGLISWDVNQSLPAFIYRYIFLDTVALFSLGMVIPSLVASYGKRLSHRSFAYFALAGFLALAYVTRYPDEFFPDSGYYLSLPMYLSAFGLCLLAVATSVKLPLQRMFSAVGITSIPSIFFIWRSSGCWRLPAFWRMAVPLASC